MRTPKVLASLVAGLLFWSVPAFAQEDLKQEALREVNDDLRAEERQERTLREDKEGDIQLGKTAFDVRGRRVRIEEYILRPAANQLKFLVLNTRENRFDYGFMLQEFKNALPTDLRGLGDSLGHMWGSSTNPSNWVTRMELFASNTIDNYQQVGLFGDPIGITFPNYWQCTETGCTSSGSGTFYLPRTMTYYTRLFGPGYDKVKELYEFDYNLDTNAGDGLTWAWGQFYTGATGALYLGSLPGVPSSARANLRQPSCSYPCAEYPQFLGFNMPSGNDSAHFQFNVKYPDNSTMTGEFALIHNNGKPLKLASLFAGDGLATAAAGDPDSHQEQKGSLSNREDINWEFRIAASEFVHPDGDIDIVIDPKIFSSLERGDNNPRGHSSGNF